MYFLSEEEDYSRSKKWSLMSFQDTVLDLLSRRQTKNIFGRRLSS